MFGYTLKALQLTNAGTIPRPGKVIGYNFKNTGTTTAVLKTQDQTNDEWVWEIEPGEAMDTRVNGGLDMTKYFVGFKTSNDEDPESQQSELLVTIFMGI